jgi:hypothetical protein
MNGYAEWLQRMPQDERIAGWYDEGHAKGYMNGEMEPALKSGIGKLVTAYAGIPKAGPPPTIGCLTAFDLPFGPPPNQLVDPYMTPEGVTILYGKGGTGKGLVACYIVVQLVRAGHVVMILDFEFHRREWGSRLRGLGLTDAELRQVHWRSPSSDDWTAAKGTVGQVYGFVRDDCDALGVTALVVDSYTVATSGDDALGGQAAAQEFFLAMSRIGRPAWVIAHVAGASTRFADRPFGSVFVHNFARETWAVEPVATVDVEPDPFQPAVVALELRNKKANGRSKAAAQFMTFSFMADGSIEADTTGPTERPLVDLIADVLAGEPLTAKSIAAAIKEDFDRTTSEEAVRVTLRRHPRRFAEQANGRPRKWEPAL